MKKLLGYVPVLLASLILFDATGTKFEVAKAPERIISLAPNLTRSLFALGLGEKIAGVTTYCVNPPEAKKKEKIGTLLEVNAEKIVSLKPDMIFATEEGNSPGAVDKLKKLRLNVFVFGKTGSFKDAADQFRVLGNITGRRAEAGAILKEAHAKIGAVKRKTAGAKRVKVFCQLGANPVITAGKGTFIDEFIRVSGGVNIASGISRYARFSREQVVKEDPDVIIMITMGDDTEKERLSWGKFREMSAVKNNRVYVVDADNVCPPTPVALVRGLEDVAKCIHPELFK